MSNPFLPKETTGLDVAFGPKTLSEFLPAMKDIPEEFKRHNGPYQDLVSSIFFRGGSIAAWQPKPGINRGAAINHFRTVLGSFEPKHEHKTAGCAYMLSEWFDPKSLGISEAKKAGAK